MTASEFLRRCTAADSNSSRKRPSFSRILPYGRTWRNQYTARKVSQPNPLDLVLGEPLLGSILELGGARGVVRRHFLGMFQCAPVGKVGGNPGGPKSVIADRRVDP